MQKQIGWWAVGLVAVALLVGQAQAGDYPQPLHTDYVYRTSRLTAPEESSFWGTWSLFPPSHPDAGVEIPAVEAAALRGRVRELAQQLLQSGGDGLDADSVLTVNSFVNLNSLYTTSALGRYLGEQMIGELQAAGLTLIDVRKTNSLMIRETYGEYGLSRDLNELSRAHDSQAVVVGTYTYAQGQILLNARVLRNRDGMVIAQASTAFALDPLTTAMLKDEATPPRRGGLIRIEAMP